jgi:hypothetical protein
MVNILELELKLECKDQLVDAFGKTNPSAKSLACLVVSLF